MEMSADEVEHQATVDRGLKMKIKRKQSGLKMADAAVRTKAAVDEDNVSAAKTQSKQTTTVYLDRRQTMTFEDEDIEGGGGGAALKSQKRKRGNNRNGRQQRDPSETTDERGGGGGGGGDAECVQSRGRDLCSGGVPRCKDPAIGGGGGAGSERSSNRRRPTSNNGQEVDRRNDSSDDQQQQQNRWCGGGGGGGRGGTDAPAAEGTAEAMTSSAAAAAVDASLESNFLTEESFQSSDPYEFIVKVEDRPQTPAKKLKVDNKMDSEMLSSSSSSSSSSSCVASKAKCDVGTVTCSVGVMTDPDCIGPCEPGTSVILEGIVWSESNNGILVVNVTWRGKTYVGTLMDATRHHWASPRFREESPSMELEYRVPKSKRGTPVTDEGRRPRKCRRTTANNGISSSSSSSSSSGTKTTRQSPGPESNGRQKGAGAGAGGGGVLRMPEAEKELTSSDATTSGAKRSRMDSDECDDAFYKCKAPDCSKKFKHISGLRYHQSQAHKRQLHPGISQRRSESSSAFSTSDIAQEKGKTAEKKKEEEDLPVVVVVVPDGAVDGGLCQVLGYEGETEAGGGGGRGGGCSLESPTDETALENFSIPRTDAAAAAADKTELPGLRGDEPQRVHGTHGCFDGPVYLSTPEEDPVDSLPEGKSIVPPAKHSTGKILEVEREEAGGQDDEGQPPVHAHAAAPDFQNAVKCSRADLDNASSRETLRSVVSETDSGQHPDGCTAKSPSRPSDLFHKPSFLHAPDVRRQRGPGHPQAAERSGVHGAHFESVQSLCVSCPSSVGQQLKLSPSAGGGNSDDRSPVYSDISDANDGGAAFSEHEGRFRRGSRDAKKPPKMEKPSLRKYEDCIGSSQPQNPSARLSSPFPSPLGSSAQNSCPPPPNRRPSESLKSREVELDQAKKTSGGGAPPLLQLSSRSSGSAVKPPVPPPDSRYRVDKAGPGGPGGNFNADMLKAQESGLLWMEMVQRASAIPYGYGVDPLAHMQLMSTNAEYRSHYERWYMGQQCYRQLMQAETEKCIGIDKPVDMSAKSAASSASNSLLSDSKAMVKLHSKPSTNSIIAEEGGSDRCRGGAPSAASTTTTNAGFSSIELNQNAGLDHHHHHHHHQHHHDDSVQFRSKALLPKQESVLLRNAEREEKPLDLMNAGSVNKAKGKQQASEVMACFSSGSPSSSQSSVRPKAPPAFIADNSPTVASNQDFSKASPAAPQVRYEGNFPPHFPGFQGPAYLDPSLNASGGGGGGRYPVLNSKYPPTGSEKSSSTSGAQGRKTAAQTTTPLLMHSSSSAAKDLSPASKNSSDGGAAAAAAAAARQSAADGFEFSSDPLSSAQDKPPATPLSSGHSSPLTLRHLHTHHHTHVVGAAPYSIYGSYNGLMSPVPTIVPSVVPVISPTYLPK